MRNNEVNIQYQEEQENLKLDSERLKVEKNCYTCRNVGRKINGSKMCPILSHMLQIAYKKPKSEMYCSLYKNNGE